MKNRIKIFALTLLTALLVFTSVSFNPIRVEAGLKDGTYNFSPCSAAKFQIKNNTLTLKMEKKLPETGIMSTSHIKLKQEFPKTVSTS